MCRLSKQERQWREALRGQYPLEPVWYAVMTHYGQERPVRERLEALPGVGIDETLLPALKASVAALEGGRKGGARLFPSYVFLRCAMSDEIYVAVSEDESVIQILGRAYRIPTPIEEEEIRHLRALLASFPPPTIGPRLNVGSEAVVADGFMAELRGRVVECNAQHVKLETCFSFLDSGTSIIVVVPRSQVRLTETAGGSPRAGRG